MISVQEVRIRPGKGKGKSDGWFPQPHTHNIRRVCTKDPETKLPMHSLCPTREWEREWYVVTTLNIISGKGLLLFPFGATPPRTAQAEEVFEAEPIRALNRGHGIKTCLLCGYLGRRVGFLTAIKPFHFRMMFDHALVSSQFVSLYGRLVAIFVTILWCGFFCLDTCLRLH